MDKILIGVAYLESSDINPDGSLKPHVTKGKPVIVMVQGNFCGYCTMAKPAYAQLAKALNNCVVATIQSDGSPSERQASKLVSQLYDSKGVPAYLGFNSNGKLASVHSGGRDVQSLQQFASSLN
jgi:thiol-disulfide isomerase/thioredoxin